MTIISIVVAIEIPDKSVLSLNKGVVGKGNNVIKT